MNNIPYRSIHSRNFIASGTTFYREKPFVYISLRDVSAFYVIIEEWKMMHLLRH
jgi:hypothetical protein